MAPEIKESKEYDGKKVDIFAAGVILFVMAVGLFPFAEATLRDVRYSCIANGERDQFWKQFGDSGAQDLSANFKDLIGKMLSHDPKYRPSAEEINNHPWMQEKSYDHKQTRKNIIARL